jgi:outer membrane protein OmpA-like peptidoglycan-associated protein
VKQKVEAERLKAVGFGPDKPTATNDTPAGREQNRRVEFNFETPGTTTTHELQDAPF